MPIQLTKAKTSAEMKYCRNTNPQHIFYVLRLEVLYKNVILFEQRKQTKERRDEP